MALMFVFSFIITILIPEPRWLRLGVCLGTGIFWTHITGLNPFPLKDENELD